VHFCFPVPPQKLTRIKISFPFVQKKFARTILVVYLEKRVCNYHFLVIYVLDDLKLSDKIRGGDKFYFLVLKKLQIIFFF